VTFHDLVRDVRKVKCVECRDDRYDCLHVVIEKDDLRAITPLFQDYFGTALKAPDAWSSHRARRYAAPFRGIRVDQTFYCADHGGPVFDCAMVWPWKDGHLLTVKIIRSDREVLEPKMSGWVQKIRNLFVSHNP
jgi:hypothetical protein